MTTPAHLLDPDVREAARRLVATGRLRAESDPEFYRAAVKGGAALAQFFRTELGWRLEVHEVAGLVRLHKRRVDVPDDRGPRLPRDGRQPQLAPTEVLVLVCLVCEQLWRRPRISLRELLQAVAQMCAAEAATGRLPQFRIVASDGTGKKEARESRRHLVDALKLLAAEGSLTVDADLDRAVTEEDSDLVVTASRDRLAAKFSSLSPALLGLDELPPNAHAAALSAESLLDHAPPAGEPAAPRRDERRLKALRRLVDDPATDPRDDAPDTTAYLHTLTGRERALNLISCLGLAATVRRDWWQTTDPTGLGSGIDFPQGRRTERQAALALLAELGRRPAPTAALTLAEITALFQRHRDALPRWAAAYDRRMPALARAAAAELAAAGLLTADPDLSDHWHPTPGVYLWRIQARLPAPPSPQPPEPAPEPAPIPPHPGPAGATG